MAAPKPQSASSSGAGKKTDSAPRVSQTGPVTYGPGKPDQAVYDAEQASIKVEIDALQIKLSAVKDKLSSGKGGPANDRKAELRAQLDELRSQQSSTAPNRSKIIEQLKAIQESIQKKRNDLNAAKAKIPVKTVQDADNHISKLEKQIESGSMKLADEKRALQEVSQYKRHRRAIEALQADENAIEAVRATENELRTQLDDPEAKAASERMDAIKAELKVLKEEGDEAYANRSKLIEERTTMQAELDELYSKKRDSAGRFRDARDQYWSKVHEDKARRAERARAERAAEEQEKKKGVVDKLREEAASPAYQTQIEDCQTLIDHFSGGALAPKSPSDATEPSDASKLEIRKVEPVEGLVALKKKGQDDEEYFVGGKGKKNKKGAKGSSRVASEASSPTGQLNIPFGLLSALLSMSIPPPTSNADVPRLIEDLQMKKAWFEANQERVTAENKAKAEADIRRILGNRAKDDDGAATPSSANAEGPAVTDETPNDEGNGELEAAAEQ